MKILLIIFAFCIIGCGAILAFELIKHRDRSIERHHKAFALLAVVNLAVGIGLLLALFNGRTPGLLETMLTLLIALVNFVIGFTVFQ